MLTMHRAAAAALLLAAAAPAALAGDYIQRKDGTFSPAFKGDRPESAADFDASDWQVLDADMANVLYQIPVGGKPQTQKIAAGEVMELYLEPKDFPPLWKEAAANLQGGDWANAAAKFRAIGDEKKVHPVLRQRALLNAARATAGPGDAKAIAAADGTYEYLLKSFPTSFYTRAVWKDRWQMSMDAGKEDGAKAAIDQLLKLAGVTDADKLEARFALTTIAFRKAVADKDQGAIQKCQEEYKALAAETQGKPALASIYNLARIGLGNCLLELGNPGEAKGLFEDISQRGNENSVLAAAFNGLGECWFRQNKPEGFVEARRCFLRVQLLYADGAPADAVAKAMYYTGECFFRLMDSDVAKTRARQELSTCIGRFPNSPWADRARKLLANIPK